MKTKRHPATRWTLTKCYHELYDTSEFSDEYKRAIVAQLHSWERYSECPSVGLRLPADLAAKGVPA